MIAERPCLLNPIDFLKKKKYQEKLEGILKKSRDRRGIIIFTPTIDWGTSLYQRPHQLARAFAKEGYLVFFCTNNLRFDSVKGFNEVENNLYLSNQTGILAKIPEKTILIVSWAINRFYVHRFNNSFIVYDYMDELKVFDGKDEDLQNDHDFLVKTSDLVLATADALFEEVSLNSDHSILIPNGVDVDHFKGEYLEIPNDIENIVKEKKPIIGYYGALARWFDYDLLIKAARKKNDWNFIAIGPLDYDKSFVKKKHLNFRNLFFLGPKDYNILPKYAKYFDVAIIPFKVNDITRATSPIKLFEYMALGKPIVTTNMPECRKYKSVLVAKNETEFIKMLGEALKLKGNLRHEALVLKEARENSWSIRVKEIEKYLPKN